MSQHENGNGNGNGNAGAAGKQEYFDRKLGALYGVPDVLHTSPTTIQVAVPLTGDAQTFIVQTYRERETANGRSGETVFLQYVDARGSTRIVLPPAVTACVARQRDALTTRSRRAAARAAAADRKAAGIVPAFLKGKAKAQAGKPTQPAAPAKSK